MEEHTKGCWSPAVPRLENVVKSCEELLLSPPDETFVFLSAPLLTFSLPCRFKKA